MFMSRRQTSLLAQFRAGTLPLDTETGRWAGTQADERVCNICRNGSIEDEVHFLCVWPEYESCRVVLYESVLYEPEAPV